MSLARSYYKPEDLSPADEFWWGLDRPIYFWLATVMINIHGIQSDCKTACTGFYFPLKPPVNLSSKFTLERGLLLVILDKLHS
jgi:hypothetical protein